MKTNEPTTEELELFWEPVKTKEELAEHMRTFLNIELPDQIIDEESTSTPMDFVWDVYYRMTTNKGYARHVVAASRNCYKTLTTAIIHFYNIIHCRRDAVQISAELQQSAAALDYVSRFIDRSFAKMNEDKNNTKVKRFINMPINNNWLTKKTDVTLKVVTATKKGANSSRSSCLTKESTVLVKFKNINMPINLTISNIYKRIEQGEKLQAFSYDLKTKQFVTKEIVAAQKRKEKNVYVIETVSKNKIRCTKDHVFPVISNSSIIFKKAEDILPEDLIIEKNKVGQIVNTNIKSISKEVYNDYVYDIQIEDTHLFFANNSILTHNCLIFDEVDLTPLEILGEAAYIADPERYTGFDPVFVYISSRKSNDGPIQKLIDEYENKRPEDLKLHKWSVVDTMRRCPEDVCDSTKPAKAFMHMETLEVIWGQDKFEAKVKEGKEVWKTINAYEDCEKCPAFVACQGRSKKQTKNYKTLRSHTSASLVLKTAMSTGGASSIISQALNLKPETSAIVFSNFNPTKNVMDYINFYKWISGNYYNPLKLLEKEIEEIISSNDAIKISSITPSKEQIYEAMIENKWTLHCGVDWGLYDPAVALLVGYHKSSRRAAVLHIEASSGYPNEDWAKYIKKNIYDRFPFDLACPDMADPSSSIYFSRLKIPSLNTKPSKIETGVQQIKSLIFNPFTLRPDLIILDDGDLGQNKLLIESLQKWTYQKNVTGYNYSKFEDNEYTHTIDALRYALAPFIEAKEVKFSFHQSYSDNKFEDHISTNDKKDLEKLQQKQELENHFKEYMLIEHGIKDLKSPGEILNNKPKKSKTVKFKI